MNDKTKCKIEGCNNNRVMKGWNKNGTRQFRTLCDKHWHLKIGKPRLNKKQRRHFAGGVYAVSKQPCVKCGWNKSYCDRHRVLEGQLGGKYEVGNVIPLCPNCHRELHEGNYESIL